MNRLLTIFLLLFLAQLIGKSQISELQKIIITTPQVVVIDNDISKKIANYEEFCIKPTRDYLISIFDTITFSDTLPEKEKLHYEFIVSFIKQLSISSNTTYNVANGLQGFTAISNKNQTYLPIHYSGDHSISELRNLAENYGAEYILFIDTVRYLKRKGRIICEASLNLYDQYFNEIVYNHTDFNQDHIESSPSTCQYENKEIEIYTHYTYDFSQMYRILSNAKTRSEKRLEKEKRILTEKRKKHLVSLQSNIDIQTRIKTILYSNTDTSKIVDYYSGLINDDHTKLLGVCIEKGEFPIKRKSFPCYNMIICSGTFHDNEWRINVGSMGQIFDSTSEPEDIKRKFFLNLVNTGFFKPNSLELNPLFWSDGVYKQIKFL